MKQRIREKLAGMCLVGLGFLPAGCLGSDDQSCECPDTGTSVEESRELPAFSRVRLDTPGSLTISQGPASPLTVRADENLIDRLTSEVDGDTLTLGLADGCFCSIGAIAYQVSTEEIRRLDVDGFGVIDLQGPVDTGTFHVQIDGDGEVAITGPLDADQLAFTIEGFGSIDASALRAEEVSLTLEGDGRMEIDRVDTTRLRSEVGGHGTLVLAGNTDLHEITMTGDGEVDAFRLSTATTAIDITGFGRSGVTVAESLDVSLSGDGEVHYCGQPRVTESIDGRGDVRRAASDRCPGGT